MTLDEKIGQLFVYAARAVFMNEESPEYRELVRQVRDNHVGGIVWSLSDVYETAFLTRRLQSMARRPLLIAADLEAGIGMRFQETTYWPWPMAVAAAGDPSLAERQGRVVAQEARALGVNQIYAPVADVNDDPGNPVINVRSYGEDPSEVARYVVAFVRGVQAGGVIATVKHFPGHGDTRTDSHRSLPVLEVARDRLERVELIPFRAAISAGVDAVMTAHLSLPLLDATAAPERHSLSRENPYTGEDAEVAARATVPASLSPAITGGLLRRELRFEGLVVTDAADMGALTDHFDPGETAVRAILAGADQIPKSPDIDRAIAAVRHAVEEGRISRERLDASVRRILAAKARAVIRGRDVERIFREVDRREHRELAEEIARRSLTLIREASGSLPLPRSVRLLHLVVGDGAEKVGEALDGELSKRLENPHETRLLDPRSGEAEIEAAVAAAARADTVLVSLFVRFQTGRGSLAAPDAARRAVEQILVSGIPVVAVSFGSPYVLSELHGLPTFLAAYGAQKDVQAAAARALFGEAAIGGRLPVTIPGIAPRGSGIVKPATAGVGDSSHLTPVRRERGKDGGGSSALTPARRERQEKVLCHPEGRRPEGSAGSRRQAARRETAGRK
jgi:beta-N-acetylhexosaminidase